MTKKNKTKVTPEEALEFLETMRKFSIEKDEPTIAISLRVPGNLLRAAKLKAKADGKKYQSLLMEYIRQGIRRDS